MILALGSMRELLCGLFCRGGSDFLLRNAERQKPRSVALRLAAAWSGGAKKIGCEIPPCLVRLAVGAGFMPRFSMAPCSGLPAFYPCTCAGVSPPSEACGRQWLYCSNHRRSPASSAAMLAYSCR